MLHSWWVRYFINVLNRFNPDVRESFKVQTNPGTDIRGASGSRTRRISDQENVPSLNDEEKHTPVSKLELRSQKMISLEEILSSAKKLSSQAVGLLLTAQSQVQFVKRRSNAGDYGVEYCSNKKEAGGRGRDACNRRSREGCL